MSNTSRCSACGKEGAPGGSFCPYCGTPSAPTWLDDLVSHDGGARSRALQEFGRLGAAGDEAVARLAASLRQPAGLPAEALLQLGRHVDEAVKAILDGMTKHDSIDVRRTNYGSLMKCGERALPALPALREILRDALRGRAAFEDVAEHATRVLGWIGPGAVDAVYDLIQALQYRDPKVREAAAWSLGRVGAGGKASLPYLMAAVQGPDKALAAEAEKSLKLIR